MECLVDLRPDLAERVQYNSGDFPVYLRWGELTWYPDYAAVSHWHDDIELIAVQSGWMDYNVNGEIIRINAGEGIFVNARQLHFGFNPRREDCTFICLLMQPVLLCSSLHLEQRYLTPLLSDGGIPYQHLSGEVPWQGRILEAVGRMYELREAPAVELKYQSLFYDIWWELYTNLNPARKPQVVQNRRLSSLKAMTAFIEANYQNRITLEDICAAGSVGKTSCCQLFGKYVNQTPNAYLVNVRLRKGAELLVTTDMTIAEICYEVGFSGASYFTEMFRRSYGISPSEFRKRHQEK